MYGAKSALLFSQWPSRNMEHCAEYILYNKLAGTIASSGLNVSVFRSTDLRKAVYSVAGADVAAVTG